jgi:hypothetical protein
VGSYEKLPEVRAALAQWLRANVVYGSRGDLESYLNDPRPRRQKTSKQRLCILSPARPAGEADGQIG